MFYLDDFLGGNHMSITDFKISAIDSSKGLSLGEYATNSENVKAKAYGNCGFGAGCAGGGGQCGFGSGCAGGGGQCGFGAGCSGS